MTRGHHDDPKLISDPLGSPKAPQRDGHRRKRVRGPIVAEGNTGYNGRLLLANGATY